MGGKDGARGYLYQTIASVLESLHNDGWKYVKIEPNTPKEKIDVLWEYKNSKEKAVQVKSSINNLSKADINNWLTELAGDASSVEKISLLLIGTVNDTTKAFLNKLNNLNELSQEEKESLEIPFLSSYEGDVCIQLENFEHKALEAKINTALDNFLTKRGYIASFPQREMMVGAIIYQFFGFTMSGKKVSREEFENNILEWVRFNYPQITNSIHTNYLPFKVAEYDYRKMLELSDIFYSLHQLDNIIIVGSNKVHDGWANFVEGLDQYWKNSFGPFIDGKNQQLFSELLLTINKYAKTLSNASDPTLMQHYKENPIIKIWGEDLSLNVYGISQVEFSDIKMQAEKCLECWGRLKAEIENRYYRERARGIYL
ncbi:hypothetical protein WKH56_08140 [Priestia sp. SB1]|uniref:hypothetical protein n=1 Tax=Priestia sp. SB1 TaxID=3132359 RepID=UPI0031778D0D